MTQIIFSRPPNFDIILAAFPMAKNHGVIFAYDGAIYVPSGDDIPPSLIAHEKVHLERQAAIGADNWWHLYIQNPTFRLYEELLAHREEYRALIRYAENRQQRRSALKEVVKRITSPLYGNIIDKKAAEHFIRGDHHGVWINEAATISEEALKILIKK